MIQSEKELKTKEFRVFKTMKLGYSWELHEGDIIKITKFNGNEIHFKLKDGIKRAAEQCMSNNLKHNKKELVQLKNGLDVWIKEPEKFEYKNNEGFGNHWWHKEGKKCKYSYLDTLGYWFPKEEFEKYIIEKQKEIDAIESGSKDDWYYKLVSKEKYRESVKKFNNHIELIK